ncbi:uracil-DNA glycosylase [Candidatus Williamhamiltonella defendens]|uniref:uracil-DNA glycosylase n=1 Tax=Candidatus Williamhamiltonella defendens TaxID=138072 RepID=UPI00130E193A|nr:uracil-DNA glycosylase [Candidatus Hamiltonella defensa]
MPASLITWRDVIGVEKKEFYFKDILASVAAKRRANKIIYPSPENVFNAFRLTEFGEVKVVIIGQDPYHGPNQAHGLSFSVLPGIVLPPSLVNIYKELLNDIVGFIYPNHGCLENWAKQGVLLLNTVLTVEAGLAHSHAHLGWGVFTDRVIAALNQHIHRIIFLLWGSHAHKKGKIIDTQRHFILKAPHPSPLSAHRGFFGCKHFSKTNQLLEQQGLVPIRWQL